MSMSNVGWSSRASDSTPGAGATTRSTADERVVLEAPLQLDSLQAVETELDRLRGAAAAASRSRESPTAAGSKPFSALASSARSGWSTALGCLPSSVARTRSALVGPGQDQIAFFDPPDTILTERVKGAPGFLDRRHFGLIVPARWARRPMPRFRAGGGPPAGRRGAGPGQPANRSGPDPTPRRQIPPVQLSSAVNSLCTP